MLLSSFYSDQLSIIKCSKGSATKSTFKGVFRTHQNLKTGAVDGQLNECPICYLRGGKMEDEVLMSTLTVTNLLNFLSTPPTALAIGTYYFQTLTSMIFTKRACSTFTVTLTTTVTSAILISSVVLLFKVCFLAVTGTDTIVKQLYPKLFSCLGLYYVCELGL